jgi:hypothetical protein
LFETAKRQDKKPHWFLFDLFTKSTADAQAALCRNPLITSNQRPILRGWASNIDPSNPGVKVLPYGRISPRTRVQPERRLFTPSFVSSAEALPRMRRRPEALRMPAPGLR